MATTSSSAPRITKADNFKTLLTLSQVQGNPQLVKFIEHELELLSKKNSAEKKPTAQQTANAGVQEKILAGMAADPNFLFTITDLIKKIPACADLTNQRVSALMSQLVKAGKVKRTEVKRKAYFQYAKPEDEEA